MIMWYRGLIVDIADIMTIAFHARDMKFTWCVSLCSRCPVDH